MDREKKKEAAVWFAACPANQELFFGDLEKIDFTYHHAFLKNRPMFLKKNAMPSAAATIACTR